MIKFLKLLEEYGGGEYSLPDNHKAGMRVPTGGACCANCKYWVVEKQICSSTYYEAWAGKKTIPGNPKNYCTDWWEPMSKGVEPEKKQVKKKEPKEKQPVEQKPKEKKSKKG